MENRLYYYVTSMWYESRCKNKNEIKRIIKEEIKTHPDMPPRKLALHTLRRCKSEL